MISGLNLRYNFLLPFLSYILYYLLLILIIKSIPGLTLYSWGYILLILLGFEGIISLNLTRLIDLPRSFPLLELALFWLLLKLLCPFPETIYLWLTWGLGALAWLNIRGLTTLFIDFNVDYKKILAYDNWKKNWAVEDHKQGLQYNRSWQIIKNRFLWLNPLLIIIWLFNREPSIVLVLCTLLFLILQFVLLTILFLEKKKLEWHLQLINFPPLFGKIWIKVILITLLITILISIILPVNTGGISFYQLINWLNKLFAKPLSIEIQPPEREIYTNEIPQPAIEEIKEGPPSLLKTVIYFIILIVIAFIILLLAGVLLFLLGRDLRKFNNIFYFTKWFYTYLKQLLKALLRSIIVGFTTGQRWVKEKKRGRLKSHSIAKLEDLTPVSASPRKLIYRIYLLMLKTLSRLGETKAASQTPYEYAEKASVRFPEVQEEIKGLTAFYVEEVYSKHLLKEELRRVIKSYWQRFRTFINSAHE